MSIGLPAYRHIHMRIFAGAAGLAPALTAALSVFGAADVQDHGPYWKIPEDIEYTVDLTPAARVAECARRLRELAPAGWHGPASDDDLWSDHHGEVFLHPAVNWANMSLAEAPALPRFAPGDVVHTPVGRAEVRGRAASMERPVWSYAVIPIGEDETLILNEPDLSP